MFQGWKKISWLLKALCLAEWPAPVLLLAHERGMAVMTEIPSNAEYAVGLGTLGIYLGNEI